jgi:FHA domain-containing protein
MVVSWDSAPASEPGSDIKTVILPSPRRNPPSAPLEARQPQQPQAASAGAAPAASAAAQAPVHGATSGPASSAAPDELLRAFLSGCGVSDLRPEGGLTPELMKLIGELLRESTRGTLDLLLARALTKREVRAQATVIVARENNPLKFSPNVEAALTNLLAAQGKGFMTPVDAMRDAYNDLRSHQFGFMAGMRAALAGVLTRFDPAQLEQRLTGKSMLSSILPSGRRAKLWELYEQLYRDISREAEDDFQALFGKEFLRAYEAQIDKLEQEDADNKR